VALACFQVQALAVEASRHKRTFGPGRSQKRYPTRKNNNMGYEKTPTTGYQKAPTPSTTHSRKKPNIEAFKVLGARTVSQRSKATVSACKSQGLSNTNDITNEESIDSRDNRMLKGVGTITVEGFSNNNNIKSEASSGGSRAVCGNGNSKGMSSYGGSRAVRDDDESDV
nr:hypothetical protein [Tanacetum cinerariifolium]